MMQISIPMNDILGTNFYHLCKTQLQSVWGNIFIRFCLLMIIDHVHLEPAPLYNICIILAKLKCYMAVGKVFIFYFLLTFDDHCTSWALMNFSKKYFQSWKLNMSGEILFFFFWLLMTIVHLEPHCCAAAFSFHQNWEMTHRLVMIFHETTTNAKEIVFNFLLCIFK